MNRAQLLLCTLVVLCMAPWLAADEPSNEPKPVPATRPEMKAALEALKERQPRIPLPDPEHDAAAVDSHRRSEYLPEEWGNGGGLGGSKQNNSRSHSNGMGQDPGAKLDHQFTDACFWVVSRGNNCHYCLGHQELTLRIGGLSDDAIAALDCDWSGFEPRMQAALGYTRKLTIEPQLVGADDIANLKKVFSDPEIIELTFDVARFNATNRWTDGMGLPQERRYGDAGEESLVTPTSEQVSASREPGRSDHACSASARGNAARSASGHRRPPRSRAPRRHPLRGRRPDCARRCARRSSAAPLGAGHVECR